MPSSPGRHKIRIELPGFETQAVLLDIPKDQPYPVVKNVTLVAIESESNRKTIAAEASQTDRTEARVKSPSPSSEAEDVRVRSPKKRKRRPRRRHRSSQSESTVEEKVPDPIDTVTEPAKTETPEDSSRTPRIRTIEIDQAEGRFRVIDESTESDIQVIE